MRAHRRGPQTDTRHGGCCCWSACGPAPQATAVSQLCAPTVRAACRVRVAAPGRLRSGHRTPAQLSGGPAFAPTDQASRACAGAAARRLRARVGGVPGSRGAGRLGAAGGPGHREDAGRRAAAPVRRRQARQAVSLGAARCVRCEARQQAIRRVRSVCEREAHARLANGCQCFLRFAGSSNNTLLKPGVSLCRASDYFRGPAIICTCLVPCRGHGVC